MLWLGLRLVRWPIKGLLMGDYNLKLVQWAARSDVGRSCVFGVNGGIILEYGFSG